MNDRSPDETMEPDSVVREQQDHDADGNVTDSDAVRDRGVDMTAEVEDDMPDELDNSAMGGSERIGGNA